MDWGLTHLSNWLLPWHLTLISLRWRLSGGRLSYWLLHRMPFIPGASWMADRLTRHLGWLGRLRRLTNRCLATSHAVRSIILGHRWLAGWRLSRINSALLSLWVLLRNHHRLRLLARLSWKRCVDNALSCLRWIHIDNLLRLRSLVWRLLGWLLRRLPGRLVLR